MIRDCIAVTSSDAVASDTAFAEAFWAKRFESVNPENAKDEASRSEEFRTLKLFLGELPEGARILDGGCGMDSTRFENGRQRRRVSRSTAAPASGEIAPGRRFYQWCVSETELMSAMDAACFDTLLVAPIHKTEGLRRMLAHDFGVRLRPGSLLETAVLRLTGLFVSTAYVSHMLIAAARNRAEQA